MEQGQLPIAIEHARDSGGEHSAVGRQWPEPVAAETRSCAAVPAPSSAVPLVRRAGFRWSPEAASLRTAIRRCRARSSGAPGRRAGTGCSRVSSERVREHHLQVGSGHRQHGGWAVTPALPDVADAVDSCPARGSETRRCRRGTCRPRSRPATCDWRNSCSHSGSAIPSTSSASNRRVRHREVQFAIAIPIGPAPRKQRLAVRHHLHRPAPPRNTASAIPPGTGMSRKPLPDSFDTPGS